MNLAEVIVVCLVIALFAVVIVQPLIMISEMKSETQRLREETYEMRKEIIELRAAREGVGNETLP